MTHNLRTNNIIASVVLAIAGVILLVFPNGTLKTVSIIIGIGLLLFGIISLVNAIKNQETSFGVAVGVVSIIAGIFFMVRPSFLAALIPFIIGIVMIVNGIVNLITCTNNRALLGRGYGVSMCGAVITLVFGILIVVNPFTTASLATRVIGIGLIISGIENVISYSKMK